MVFKSKSNHIYTLHFDYIMIHVVILRSMPQAVKMFERQEQIRNRLKNHGGFAEGALVSDDDSIRVLSAISVRDSLRTDDDELQPITVAHADFLTHEYKVLNQDNLIISNLNSNIAELTIQPRTLAKNQIDNKGDENKLIQDDDKSNNNSNLNIRKLSQNLDNFSIRLKASSKSNDSEISVKNEDSSLSMSNKSQIDTILSKSVPPTFKQKILQFSKEKFGSGSGNKLTRSLKKSLHLTKNQERSKGSKERRMSEPVALNVSSVDDKTEDEKTEEEEEMEEKHISEIPEISENLKLDDTNSCDGQTFFGKNSFIYCKCL